MSARREFRYETEFHHGSNTHTARVLWSYAGSDVVYQYISWTGSHWPVMQQVAEVVKSLNQREQRNEAQRDARRRKAAKS